MSQACNRLPLPKISLRKGLLLSRRSKRAWKNLSLAEPKTGSGAFSAGGQKQPATGLDPAAGLDLDEGNEVNSIGVDDSHAGGAPQLQHPEANDHKRISQAIAKLNRELVNRLKDIAEFEEEMRKSSSSKLDKLIFLHLVNSSIAQKKLKESNSLISHDQIMSLHKKNQELQKTYFDLIDTIQSENRVRGVP